MATLVYRGAATLTFGSARGRRTVAAGEPFEVDADLATLLLVDPDVQPAGAGDVPRGTVEPSGPVTSADLPTGAVKGGSEAGLSYDDLKARARELGLTPPRKKDELVAAIAAEEQRLADEAAAAAAAQAEASSSGEGDEEGDVTPGDDPDASATGEPGTPPSGGAVVLGDEA